MNNPTTPDQGDERRAIHEWLMREHKIEVLGNPEDDTAAVISLGTLRNIARVAMSAAQPVAQEAKPALLALSHEMDDAAQHITERQAYDFATQIRVLLGLDGDKAMRNAILAAPHPSQGAEPQMVVAMDEGAREPRIASWNKFAIGTHWLYATPHHPVSAEAGKGVEREAYIADLIDTFEQLRQILGTPEQDADALIAAARRLVSESVAVSGEVSDVAIDSAISTVWEDWEDDIDRRRELARAVLALAGSAKEAAALECMARLDDEMGIEP